MSLTIETGRLSHEPEKISGVEPASSLGIEQEYLIRPEGALVYDLIAHCILGELIVQGTLKINIICCCARCGSDFQKKILISDFYRSFPLTSKNELINLTPDVREDILLSLPMVMFCSDTCRGLCSVCGANLNREKCKCKRRAKPDAWKALDDFRLSFPT